VSVKQLFSDRDRCMCMLNNVCSAIKIAVCSAIGIAVCVCETIIVQRSGSLYVSIKKCLFSDLNRCMFNDRNRCTCMCVCFFVQRSESLYVCSNNHLPTLTTPPIDIQLITVGPHRRGICNSSTREFGNSCTRRIASHSIVLPPWYRLHADHHTTGYPGVALCERSPVASTAQID
jgi:hypothetical protein